MDSDIRNVAFVVLDALRRDRLTAHGEDRNLTPNLDALAEKGTVFETAFSSINTTDASITSIHTGRDPETVVKHHGPFVTDTEKRRAESVDTAPELLQNAGYSTLVTGRRLGRWHQRGFEYYPTPALGRYERRSIGEILETVSPRLRTLARRLYEFVSAATETDDDEVDEFLAAVGDEPFYGMIHVMDTHVPYTAEDDLVDEFLDRYDYPDRDFAEFLDEHGDGQYVGDFMTEYATERDYRDGLARWYAKYDASVVHADRKVGALVEGLRDRGLLDETAIIVTSDHGESLDEHGIYFDHHGLYDPQVRVPLLAAGPGIPDARREESVQLFDLGPTFLDLLGVDTTLDGEGRSLAPLLGQDGKWESRDAVVAHEAHAQRRLSIRANGYKYIKHVPDDVLERERGDSFRCGYCNVVHGSERELYDLAADPEETENIVENRPDRAAELDDRLTAYFDDLEYPATGDETVEYEGEEAVMERLADLGYR
jgi:arylsulfatase A-like enzyme